MQRRSNVRDIVELFWNNTVMLGFESDMCSEDKIYCYKKAIELIKSVYDEGDYGFSAVRLYTAYLYLAHEYANMEDGEMTLEALENCVLYANMYDDKDAFTHSSFLVRGLEYHPEKTSKTYKENTASVLLSRLEHCVFDFVRNNKRFLRLIEILENCDN